MVPNRISGKYLEGIQSLPTLPQLMSRIMDTLEKDTCSASSLEQLLSQDQALSSRILSVANSPYYGFAAQITTVQRAVVVLGLSEVRKICLSAGMMSMFQGRRLKNLKEVEPLWLHSLMVGEAARILAARTKMVESEQAFTAGLLHDLGKLAMATVFPGEMEAIKKEAKSRNITFHQAEQTMGADHEDVGIALAEHWRLPPMMAEVLGRHHEPYPGLDYLPLVAMVHIADCLAYEIMPPEWPGAAVAAYPESLEVLELGEEGLWWVRKRLENRAEALASLRDSLF